LFKSVASEVLVFIAITIQPIMEANKSILTTSKGKINPWELVLSICMPISFTLALKGAADTLSNP
jgi:hypothetical protein